MKGDQRLITRILVDRTGSRRNTGADVCGPSRKRRSRVHDWILQRTLLVAIVLSVLCGVATSSSAQSAPSVGRQLQLNLSRNGSSTTMGEPEIAVDPQNSKNLFVDWTTFPHPLTISGAGANIPRPCGGLVSLNSGVSWHVVQVPTNHVLYTKGCGDAVAAAGPDGTLYAGGIGVTFTATGGSGPFGLTIHGQDYVTHSTNWGRTWSRPVETMGSDGQRFVTGDPVDTFDRPWLAVDQSTGTVYAAGHNLANHEGYVTASTNKAASFGPIYPIDSPTYPSEGFSSSNIVAAHGVLAEAYASSQAPGHTCPCLIFETSTDHGATFTRHIVPTVSGSSSPEPFLAADPTVRGRFALTIFDSTGTENQVYVSDDSGATWHGPTLVGENPPNPRFKPWITFGTSGNLALAWRTRYADGAYDVWAALGHVDASNGAVFSAPIRVSSVAAPYPSGYAAGDDFSWIITDAHYAHVGWGDSRNGPVQLWYGRIPLSTSKG